MTAMQKGLPTLRLTPIPGALPVAAQNWNIVKYFNFYRLAIAALALLIALTVGSLPPFGETSPPLFRAVSVIYFVLSLLALETIRRRKPDFETQVSVLGFVDITLLTVLVHASGGVTSGLGLLLVVAIGGTSLMLGRRMTVFYASLATIAIMLEHSWGLITDGVASAETVQSYPQVGLLGVALFATAFLSYTLADRLRATEAIAERRGRDIANLAHINDLIIQRMQSGVLACDAAGAVRFMNQAAQKYLGARPANGKKITLSDLSPDLAIQLFQWQGNDPTQRTRRLLTTRTNYTLLPRFVPLGAGKEAGTLVFLEDMAALKQQAQQLKMAALARLTASIAHEIRNPLGALTNAAQLLGESITEENEAKRLTKIIEEQGRRMNIIVQNVTQLSRRDRSNPTRLDLNAWISDFVTQYTETSRLPVGVFAKVGAPGVEGYFDPDQFSQVIGNLCQNALRHSPPFTGTPLIKLQTGRDAEGRPYIDVIDWGSGVPASIVDHIFDPFFTTTPKGTGLGLYIARELCEGNGASVDYYPGEGGVGSRFRVTVARVEEGPDTGPP